MKRQYRGGLAGMVGTALFVAVFTVEGVLRPGYDARRMFVSELSLGPRGWIQIANFIVFGLLLLVFARGVAAAFRDGPAHRAGPILLAVIGVCLVVSGPLVMDPATTPHDLMTLHSRLHWLFGSIVFTLAPVSCFVFLRRFWRDPAWQAYRGWTLLVAVLISIALVVWSAGPTQPPAAPNAWNAWNGLLQRAILIPYAGWLFAVALGLYRRSQSRYAPPERIHRPA